MFQLLLFSVDVVDVMCCIERLALGEALKAFSSLRLFFAARPLSVSARDAAPGTSYANINIMLCLSIRSSMLGCLAMYRDKPNSSV